VHYEQNGHSNIFLKDCIFSLLHLAISNIYHVVEQLVYRQAMPEVKGVCFVTFCEQISQNFVTISNWTALGTISIITSTGGHMLYTPVCMTRAVLLTFTRGRCLTGRLIFSVILLCTTSVHEELSCQVAWSNIPARRRPKPSSINTRTTRSQTYDHSRSGVTAVDSVELCTD